MAEQTQDNIFVNCKFVGEFDQLNVLGQGTYGTVYRASERRTGQQVAIKKMKVHDTQEGFPITSLREIKVLRRVQDHPNIVQLKEVVVGKNKDSVFLVFEYCQIDLLNLFEQMRLEKLRLQESEVKCLCLQLLKGMSHLHANFVMHRDLKLSNILLAKNGIIKIADFGLARQFEKPEKPMTKKVVTLWYRAPELLIQSKNYTKAVDTWSVGCIIAELLNGGMALFQGKSETHQFQLICETIGYPNKYDWPEFFTESKKEILREFERFSVHRKDRLETALEKPSANCLDLLRRMLCWNPKKRIDLEQAMYHPFFYQAPRACFPDQIRVLSKLEYLSKKAADIILKRRNNTLN